MRARFILAIVSTLLQEAVVAAIFLLILPEFGIIVPIRWLIVILLVWGILATAIYQIGSQALRKKPLPGLPSMIGTQGIVVKQLNPNGLVQIRGELWNAASASGKIRAGEEVTVVGQEGLKLIVTRRE